MRRPDQGHGGRHVSKQGDLFQKFAGETVKHLALKCNYNDGANQNGRFIGYAGTCSLVRMKANVAGDGRWCSNTNCPCYRYVHGQKSRYPRRPCYESAIFDGHWGFGSGATASGDPIRFQMDGSGGFAILTTVPPSEEERMRRIIGYFRILKVEEEDSNPAGIPTSTWLQSSKRDAVRLPWDDARRLYFWDYYANASGGPFWGSRLNRELTPEQVKAILTDIRDWASESRVRRTTSRFLRTELSGVKAFPKMRGARSAAPKIPVRKHPLHGRGGGGGEGVGHLRLKRYVAEHPESIGLSSAVRADIEHPFESGDQVDVCFTEKGGQFTVVEIETDNPHPAGSHQVVKYRALKCAQERYDLDDPRVHGILVAWTLPKKCRDFCDRYQIKHFEIRV